MCEIKNEDVVGAAPTGDAQTISEWSTILLPTKVRLISEVWGNLHSCIQLATFQLGFLSGGEQKKSQQPYFHIQPPEFEGMSQNFVY